MNTIETWISTNGNYLILALADSDQDPPRYFKIVSNDKRQAHINAPRLYASLPEAMKRVDDLDGQLGKD